MRTAALTWLRCPVEQCQGNLSVSENFVPTSSEQSPGELLEAVLQCAACRAEYPVVLGVAILVPEQHHYLWAMWSDIEQCAGEIPGAAISRSMRLHLGVPGAETGHAEPPGPQEESLGWTISPYLQSCFDRGSIRDDLPDGWLSDAIDAYLTSAAEPHSFLLDAARAFPDRAPGGLAVEVGTSVGRTAALLAGGRDFSIGTDFSFRAVLAARRHLLAEPASLETYGLEGERGQFEDRTLTLDDRPANLDYVVADGAALPFATEGAACLAALNVLCAVPVPGALVQQFHRIARPGGLLLVSTPYWSDSPGSPAVFTGPEDLRKVLQEGFEVIAENRMVPWLLRLAKRRFNLYLCDCLVARRRS